MNASGVAEARNLWEKRFVFQTSLLDKVSPWLGSEFRSMTEGAADVNGKLNDIARATSDRILPAGLAFEPSTKSLRDQLLLDVAAGKRVDVVAHSQGTVIAQNSVTLLANDLGAMVKRGELSEHDRTEYLSLIRVLSTGAYAAPDKWPTGITVRNLNNPDDVVPKVGGSLPTVRWSELDFSLKSHNFDDYVRWVAAELKGEAWCGPSAPSNVKAKAVSEPPTASSLTEAEKSLLESAKSQATVRELALLSELEQEVNQPQRARSASGSKPTDPPKVRLSQPNVTGLIKDGLKVSEAIQDLENFAEAMSYAANVLNMIKSEGDAKELRPKAKVLSGFVQRQTKLAKDLESYPVPRALATLTAPPTPKALLTVDAGARLNAVRSGVEYGKEAAGKLEELKTTANKMIIIAKRTEIAKKANKVLKDKVGAPITTGLIDIYRDIFGDLWIDLEFVVPSVHDRVIAAAGSKAIALERFNAIESRNLTNMLSNIRVVLDGDIKELGAFEKAIQRTQTISSQRAEHTLELQALGKRLAASHSNGRAFKEDPKYTEGAKLAADVSKLTADIQASEGKIARLDKQFNEKKIFRASYVTARNIEARSIDHQSRALANKGPRLKELLDWKKSKVAALNAEDQAILDVSIQLKARGAELAKALDDAITAIIDFDKRGFRGSDSDEYQKLRSELNAALKKVTPESPDAPSNSKPRVVVPVPKRRN